MNFTNILPFIQDHWVQIGVILNALHIVAKLIVAWTPNPKDNEFLEKAVIFLKQAVSIIGLQPPVHLTIANNTSIPKETANPNT